MKREDLKKLLGETATDEVINGIMKMNGDDIETHKTKLSTAEEGARTIQAQLDEANRAIEGFKSQPDVKAVQAAADDYKAKWEQSQKDSAAQLLAIKQNHALERTLKETFKVKDGELVAVKAHLKMDQLKFNEGDESFVGLKEQVDPLKEPHPAYFSDGKQPPRFSDSTKTSAPVDKGTFASAIQERLNSTK